MANGNSYKSIIDDFNTEAKREGGMFNKILNQADEAIVKYLQKIIKPDMKVLEVGCGMGNVIEMLECEQWALDASENMIENCNIKNKYIGNMDEMPFPDKSFDIVFMCFTLQQSLNPRKTLSEVMRVSRPNGVLYVFDGDKDSAIGQEREKAMARGEWKTCGKAQWFSKKFFNKLGYETDNLLPHVLIAKK